MPHPSQPGAQGGSQIVAVLRRYPVASVAIVLAAIALSLVYSVQMQSDTSATARLTLSDPRGNAVFRQGVTTDAAFLRYIAQRADFVMSDEVLGTAADALAADGLSFDPLDFRARVDARGDDRGDIAITARAGDAETAVAMANAILDAYRELIIVRHDMQRDLAVAAVEETRDVVAGEAGATASGSPEYAALSEALARLEIRRAEVLVDAATFDDGVLAVRPALLTTATGGTTPVINAVVGLLAGLVLAVGIGYVRSEQVAARAARAEASPRPGRPVAGRPDAGRPDTGWPDAGRPEAGRPEAGLPDSRRGEPAATAPARRRWDRSGEQSRSARKATRERARETRSG